MSLTKFEGVISETTENLRSKVSADCKGNKPELPDDSGKHNYKWELPDEAGEQLNKLELPDDSGKHNCKWELPDEAGEKSYKTELPDDSGNDLGSNNGRETAKPHLQEKNEAEPESQRFEMNIKQKETSVEEKLTTDEKTAPDLLVDDIEGDKTEGPDDSGKREYDTELPDDPGEKDIYARVVLRKDVKEQIFRDAPKDKDNNPLDPNTGLPIKGTPDIGHKPGHEHWRERIRAREEKLTREEFIEKMNDPDIYQLEDPSNNRCHKYEDKGDETV